MTPNETDTQVDAQNEANTNQSAHAETDSKSTSSNQEHTDYPSNVLDFPIKDAAADSIGMEDILEGMAEYINHAQMPFTIAVQGEWGIGKTSFLNLLKNRLCENNTSLYYPVWIDACDFTLLQSSASAVINMLQSMIYQIGNLNPTIAGSQEGKKKLETIIFFIKNLGKIVAKDAMQIATGGAISEETAEKIYNTCSEYCSNNKEKQNNDQDSTSLTVQELRNKVIELIDYILDPSNNPNYLITEAYSQQINIPHSAPTDCKNKKNQDNNNTFGNNIIITDQAKRGIVFFIDNLDRIDPTLSVEILEITKNIFDFSNSVFIVALDNNIALRGLREKLGDLTPENEPIFRAYFDKFVQQSITLPFQATAIQNLLFKSLEDIGLFNINELDNCGIKNDLITFSILTIKCNPRFIKRIVNTLSLLLYIKRNQSNNTRNSININNQKPPSHILSSDVLSNVLIFIVVCIKLFYPKIYQCLIDKHTITNWDGTILEDKDNKMREKYVPYNKLNDWSRTLNFLATFSKRPSDPNYDAQLNDDAKIISTVFNAVSSHASSDRIFNQKYAEAMRVSMFCNA